MKSFAPPFSNHFSLTLNRKKTCGMRAMRKKLNIFTFQVPIFTYQNKKSQLEREGGIWPSSFYGHLTDYLTHVLALSTQYEIQKQLQRCSYENILQIYNAEVQFVSRVIPRLYGWVYNTLRLSPLVFEHSVVATTAGSQSRRSQIESYGQPIFDPRFMKFDCRISGGIKF